MSTAAAFLHLQPFPFCPENIATPGNGFASNISNLALADVAWFVWNLENIEFSTDGTLTSNADPNVVAYGSIEIGLNPLTSNVLTQAGRLDGEVAVWVNQAANVSNFADWPSFKQPRERVCLGTQNVVGALYHAYLVNASVSYQQDAQIGFWVGTDPVNSGKYRVYYRFEIHVTDEATESLDLKWTNESTQPGLVAWTSGTWNIGSLNFDWYSYHTSNCTPSGSGDMTVSHTLFTY